MVHIKSMEEVLNDLTANLEMLHAVERSVAVPLEDPTLATDDQRFAIAQAVFALQVSKAVSSVAFAVKLLAEQAGLTGLANGPGLEYSPKA